MVDTPGLIRVIWWMTLFHPLHADTYCMKLETQESPITNLILNWRKMELSWESSMNFSEYTCAVATNKTSIQKKVESAPCHFPKEVKLPIHNGAVFTIEVPNTNISKSCAFCPGGMPGTAITNFSCVIYNVSLMNCTWHAGRDAPGDTQYFLYWQNSGEEEERECELYVKDENGRHTGCQFQNVMIKDTTTYFMVNGSSKDSLIRFHDEYIELYTIERLTPPLNVTASCTGYPQGCIIEWQEPLTSHVENKNCFQYEINIQNKDEPKEEKMDPPVRVRNYRYEFQNFNVKKIYILKIRARGKHCFVNSNWGEWSEPIEFGQGKDDFIFVILVLIALGTISVTLLQSFLCKRYCSFKRICSPIPQPRDKFNILTDEDTQKEYVNLPKKGSTEDIIMVEEMT
ncbi:granulocyte-macrophage colony-stimulating factor receptor subunit alpha-like [Apteryx mantelli]|uniref:Granulocyte-macrophage colony-stimulating factor receptor subunit alpha-like n=1 Tax=Apteryx mantelli TaxID=2696672 RepID=A0A8B7J7G1_9AVES